jgi:uncharacterized protein (DUF1800 family)
MYRSSGSTDVEQFWPAYVPTKEEPWDLSRVVQLHRRAGFAATWTELQRDLKAGPTASMDLLLSGKSYTDGVPAGFAKTAEELAEGAVADSNALRLKAWWVYRLLFGADPLSERLTLFWHNYFATSNLKVDDVALMRVQNELFRAFARAPFGKLLHAAVRDPALLIWLDAPSNRKEHPNENLARELMELFTLGVGPYTEKDIKEAARALTGWSVNDGAFQNFPARHDAGVKTILGKTGPWSGEDLVRILLAHPATAQRLATKLCGLFLGTATMPKGAIPALAAGLRERDLDVGWAVATILRSRLFFTTTSQVVRGPVEFVVGAVRALEMSDSASPPSTLVLAEWAARLGQDLFYPPNVGGWPGGRSWITTRSMIGRTSFVAALLDGQRLGMAEPFDALGLARKHDHGGSLDALLTFYGNLLLGGLAHSSHRRLLAALGPGPALSPDSARRLVALVLALPEAHLA